MNATKYALDVMAETFAVCRLDADEPLPDWVRGQFWSVTRTPNELSIVCLESSVPDSVKRECQWRCLHVVGPLEFSTVGIVASLTGTLAAANVSVFVISTFDTDCILVKAFDLAVAVASLRSDGHTVNSPDAQAD